LSELLNDDEEVDGVCRKSNDPAPKWGGDEEDDGVRVVEQVDV
jgi:hypothetical protein